MRPLQHLSTLRVALCGFGVIGSMELRQADFLAPLQFCTEDAQSAHATVSFADSHDGGTLFQRPAVSVALSSPSYAFSLFGKHCIAGKWAILRVNQTVATAKVEMKK